MLCQHELDAVLENLSRWRVEWESAAASINPTLSCEVESRACAGVPAERVFPGAGESGAGVIVWFHGGGFSSGSPRTHRALALRLADASGVAVIVPDYGLAPEHPHPAALEDALRVLHAVVDEGTAPEFVVVGGDSA